MRGFFVGAASSVLAMASVWGCDDGASGTAAQGGSVGGAGAAASGGTGAGAMGGAPSDGSAGDAGATLVSSKRHACREYLTAACERRAECSGPSGLDSCLENLALCPDYLFSDGSTRTVQGTLECAEAWKTLPCQSVQTGIAPACSTAGTRQPGETCGFASQCQSLVCAGTDVGCGVCLRLAALGESCDGVEVGCAAGLRCNLGSCETVPWSPDDVVVPIAAGEACRFGDVCVAGYACLKDPPDDTLADSRCQIPPGPGEPCVYNAVGGIACASDAYCSPSASGTRTCMRWPAAGEPCASNSSVSTLCAPGDQCESRICIGTLEEGESCGAANTRCAAGTECTGGRCVASDELTIFAQLCGSP